MSLLLYHLWYYENNDQLHVAGGLDDMGYITALDDMDIRIKFGEHDINVLYLRYVTFKENNIIATHSHSGYELHFIPAGKGMLRVEENTYEVTPGTLYLTGPGIFHEQKFDADDPMQGYCMNFEITKPLKKNIKNHEKTDDLMLISDTIINTRFWFGKDTQGCMEIFKKILDEANNRYTGYLQSIGNHIFQLFINTARCYLEGSRSTAILPEKSTDDKRRLIFDLYLERYKEKITIDELSHLAGLGRRQTERMFHKYYGMSYIQKLNHIRIQMACDLLHRTEKSIRIISESCGFEDVSYFCRIFKKIMDTTPTKFRI